MSAALSIDDSSPATPALVLTFTGNDELGETAILELDWLIELTYPEHEAEDFSLTAKVTTTEINPDETDGPVALASTTASSETVDFVVEEVADEARVELTDPVVVEEDAVDEGGDEIPSVADEPEGEEAPGATVSTTLTAETPDQDGSEGLTEVRLKISNVDLSDPNLALDDFTLTIDGQAVDLDTLDPLTSLSATLFDGSEDGLAGTVSAVLSIDNSTPAMPALVLSFTGNDGDAGDGPAILALDWEIALTYPEHETQGFSLTATVETTEIDPDGTPAAASTTASSDTVDFVVLGIADEPFLEADDVTVDEEQSVTFDIAAALTDRDLSESLVVEVTGIPDDWTHVESGNGSFDSGTGKWTSPTLSPSNPLNDLTNPTFAPPANFHSAGLAIVLTVIATTTESGTVKAGEETAQATATFDVVINPVNDPVTAAADSPEMVDEDGMVALSGLSIDDIDATLTPTGVYEIEISAPDGTVSLDGGEAASSVTMTGTLADINDALLDVKFMPGAHFSGETTVTLSVTDEVGGTIATGPDGATIDAAVIEIDVKAIADTPAFSGVVSSVTALGAPRSNDIAAEDDPGFNPEGYDVSALNTAAQYLLRSDFAQSQDVSNPQPDGPDLQRDWATKGIDGFISSAGDVDVYAFLARAGEDLHLDIDLGTAGADGVRTRLELVAPDGSVLASDDDSGTPGTDGSGAELADPEIAGDPFGLVTAPADGFYYVIVRHAPGGTAAEESGDYHLYISIEVDGGNSGDFGDVAPDDLNQHLMADLDEVFGTNTTIEPVALDIVITTPDQDGSDRLFALEISGLQTGATISFLDETGTAASMTDGGEGDSDGLADGVIALDLTAYEGSAFATGPGGTLVSLDTSSAGIDLAILPVTEDDMTVTVTARTQDQGADGVPVTTEFAEASTDIEVGFEGAPDILVGTAGADDLDGGAGTDILLGLAGADTLTGGSGADIFVLSAGDSTPSLVVLDEILDFEDGTDLIGLAGGLGFADVASIVDDGSDATLTVNDGAESFQVRVHDTLASELDSSDFIVVP